MKKEDIEPLENIESGGNYTCVNNNRSVEVLQFKDFKLDNDSYQDEIKTVIYIDEDSNIQSMEIDTFASKHKKG